MKRNKQRRNNKNRRSNKNRRNWPKSKQNRAK